MGDSRRFEVLAKFIMKNFVPCSVADVAGGQGYLSFALTQHGYSCTVIDPRKTNLSKKERQIARCKNIEFRRLQKEFEPEMAYEYDLIVGLHPDQATEAICEAALIKSCIIVPCCQYWSGIENHGSPNLAETIRRKFRRNGVKWWETFLKMNGKNLVFVTLGP